MPIQIPVLVWFITQTHTATEMAALGLTSVLVGLGSIGAGIGFDVAEKEKMDELNTKARKLKDDVNAAGNLYDYVYYLVSENLARVKKALDKLPTELLEKVKTEIAARRTDSTADKAITVLGQVLGAAPSSPVAQRLSSDLAEAPSTKANKQRTGIFACCVGGMMQQPKIRAEKPQPEQLSSEEPTQGSVAAQEEIEMVELVRSIREQKAQGTEPASPQLDPFENVPLDGEEIPARPADVSSFSKAPMLDKVVEGLDIASAVFGVAGLAATIGLGVWTLDKLNKAIEDVETKQKQVTTFQTAMKNVLDKIDTAVGLPAENYGELTNMAATWKTISENCDSYEKSFYYAIRGYFMKKSLDEVKEMVQKECDPGKPFPDDAYPLAKTLADEIRNEFGQNKADKEIVVFFANENPNISQRCVFSEFFISSLRKVMQTISQLE